MEALEPVREFVATLDLEIFKAMEEARRDVERITGIANLDDLARQGEIEARWRRYHDSIAVIQKQREVIAKTMADIMALEYPKPILLPRS